MPRDLPLAGVTIVDLTSNVAGPFASLILADFGADVVKIERPGRGDDTRSWGPPFLAGSSVTHASLNRNKRSVELDLSDADGLAALRRLLRDADVLIQNLRPGALQAFGLDYDTVRSDFPRLIYCELTGFGGVGPMGDEAGYDPLLQAFSGIMTFNTQQGSATARVPVSILDKGTGMWAALGILAAIHERDRTGRGCHVETSLAETAACWLSTQVISYLTHGTNPPPAASRTAGIAPYQVFRTADGEVLIAAGNDTLFQRMCLALEAPDLILRPQFAHNPDRVVHVDELEAEIEKLLADLSVEEVCRRMKAASVPASPLNQVGDFVDSAQMQSLAIVQEVTASDGSTLATVGPAVRFDGDRPGARLAPPDLGEATHELVPGLDAFSWMRRERESNG